MPSVTCPKCNAQLKVPDEAIGKRARCKHCQTVIRIPAQIVEAPQPSALDTARTTVGQVTATAGGLVKMARDAITRPTAAPPPIPAPVQALTPLMARLTAEDQDIEKTAAIVERVQQILMASEELLYVAVQAKPIANWFPDAIVLTNRRFIAYQPKMLGRVHFEDYIWRDLKDVQLKEDIIGATLSFRTAAGGRFSMDYLPKKQARQLYRISQEHEIEALEERRRRHMEETRAAAGGVVIQNAVGTTHPVAGNDPMARLSQLKQMLDAGLISSEEFERKKNEILSAM